MTVEAPAPAAPPPKGLLRSLPPDLLAFLIGYAVLLPLYLAPLFVTRFLPGLDLPFHLALADLLVKLPGGAGPYPVSYEGSIHFAPYALPYWLLSQMAALFTLNTANKLLLALYIGALPLASGRLLAACGRSRLPALLTFPLCYNLSFYAGFASFLLSLPLLVLLLAQAADNTDDLHEDDEGAFPMALLRDGVLVALGVLLFLTHLGTFLFGVAAVLVLVAFSEAPLVYRIRVALSLLPGVAALGWWQASAVGSAMPDRPLWIIINSVLRARAQELTKLSLGGVGDDLWARLWALPQHLLTGFRDGSHLDGTRWIAAGLAFYFATAVLGVFARGGDRSQGRMAKAGVMLLLLTIGAYLGLPEHMPKLGMSTMYPRLAVLIALWGLLLVPSWLKRYPRWALPVLALPALAAAGAYGVELTRHFDRFGQEQSDFAQVLDKTPADGKVLGLVFDRDSKVVVTEGLLAGLPSYYPVERPGAGSMVAQVYCDLDHMPCRTKEIVSSAPPAPSPFEPQKLQPEKAVPYFNYFFVRSGPRPQTLFGSMASNVEVLATQGTWTVYRRKEAILADKARPLLPGAKPEAKPEAQAAGAAPPQVFKSNRAFTIGKGGKTGNKRKHAH